MHAGHLGVQRSICYRMTSK